MKKPFKETKIGKFLTSSIGLGLIKMIPVVGPLANNVLNENNSSPGEVDHKELASDVVQAAMMILVLIYLLGWIDFDQAQEAKELISP